MYFKNFAVLSYIFNLSLLLAIIVFTACFVDTAKPRFLTRGRRGGRRKYKQVQCHFSHRLNTQQQPRPQPTLIDVSARINGTKQQQQRRQHQLKIFYTNIRSCRNKT